MKFPPVVLAVFALLFSQFVFAQRVYIDAEDNQYVSVFSKPGYNWKTCKWYKLCKAEGWPDNQTEVEVFPGVTPETKMVENPFTGVEEEVKFVYVKFRYTRKSAPNSKEKGGPHTKDKEGWIDASHLRTEKPKPIFSERLQSSNQHVCSFGTTTGYSQIQGMVECLENKSTNDAAAAIKNKVGICGFDNVKPPIKFNKQVMVDGKKAIQVQLKPADYGIKSDKNPYDRYILDKVLSQKVPKIEKVVGKGKDQKTVPMTSTDLVEIDALARTLYGEMSKCFKHGLHYPMAIAKIIVNRFRNPKRYGTYIQGDHDSRKSTITKIVTTPNQLNNWMAKIKGEQNGSNVVSICPPTTLGKAAYMGMPNKEEVQVWDNAVKIATEAILFPQRFDRRTDDVKVEDYTSAVGYYYGFDKKNPTIEGRKITRDSCLEAWQRPTKSWIQLLESEAEYASLDY